MVQDIGTGMLMAILLCKGFSVKPEWIHLVFGIIFSLLPDIDALPEYFKTGKVPAGSMVNPRDHRDGLHYPIPLILIFSAFAFIMSTIFSVDPVFWSSLCALCIFMHLVHDTYGVGWGIAWLYPFTGLKTWRKYKLFCKRDNTFSMKREHIICSWSAEEQPRFIWLHGDRDWFGKFLTSWLFDSEVFILFVAIIVTAVVFESSHAPH